MEKAQEEVVNQPVKKAVEQPAQKATEQPVAKPVEKKSKKKIIIWSCVGGVVVIAVILAAILIPMLSSFSYKTAYNVAEDVKDEIRDLYYSDCNYAESYVNSKYSSPEIYDGYVSDCREHFTDDIAKKIDELENTDGVKRDSTLNEKFKTFKDSYNLIAKSSEDVNKILDIYSAWHRFAYNANEVATYSKDALNKEYAASTAKNLTESGIDELKTYGEGWYEKAVAFIDAYDAWNGDHSGISAKELSKISSNYGTTKKEFLEYNNSNALKVDEKYPLNMDAVSDVYENFKDFYNALEDIYFEKEVGGNCEEIFGELICY